MFFVFFPVQNNGKTVFYYFSWIYFAGFIHSNSCIYLHPRVNTHFTVFSDTFLPEWESCRITVVKEQLLQHAFVSGVFFAQPKHWGKLSRPFWHLQIFLFRARLKLPNKQNSIRQHLCFLFCTQSHTIISIVWMQRKPVELKRGFARAPPPLSSVRITPVPWDDPVAGMIRASVVIWHPCRGSFFALNTPQLILLVWAPWLP